METSTKTIYEYGAMSSKYSCESENKLTAYATMVMHYNRSAHMLVIYSPESSSKDGSWEFWIGIVFIGLHNGLKYLNNKNQLK